MTILAPLRGVTIRTFRRVFASAIAEAGFSEAVTPFIPANAGVDPMKDREMRGGPDRLPFAVTPQFIGKDPAALADSLRRVRDAGCAFADLNCGCPFPMIRRKGRGSGILRTPDVLRRMLEAGCSAMGPGAFSAKTRLGIDGPGELMEVLPVFCEFPLRFLCVHARTARQMYSGGCDRAAFAAVAAASTIPVVYNGDAMPGDDAGIPGVCGTMVGRGFIRSLALRRDISALLDAYAAESLAELGSTRPVLGRMKELLAYWKDIPEWTPRWQVAKMARTLPELETAWR